MDTVLPSSRVHGTLSEKNSADDAPRFALSGSSPFHLEKGPFQDDRRIASVYLSFVATRSYSQLTTAFSRLAEIIAKVQYGLKITFIFVALLFVDAVNQMLKIQREKEV